MNDVYEITRQDFTAAKAAFDDGDFQQMNIYSNRLMANALFGDQKLCAIPGFFLKKLAVEFLRTGDSGLGKELRPAAETFVGKIGEAFKLELDLYLIWNGYFEYTENTRKLHMSPVGRKTYRDNRTFTSQAVCYLTNELLAGDALFHEQGLVLKVFLTEADRLIRNHGAETKDIVLFSLIIALDHLNDYIRVACFSPRDGISQDCLKSCLSPFLERIKTWHEQPEDLPYTDATDILCDILRDWRKYCIRYMERGRVTVSEERRIELPNEAKKRISDTITQALQKDLTGKPGRNKKRR